MNVGHSCYLLYSKLKFQKQLTHFISIKDFLKGLVNKLNEHSDFSKKEAVFTKMTSWWT